jgi:hypothetical protein
MLARNYGAGVGRFLSVDPGGFETAAPGSLNRYVYAGNNPLRYVDPDGEEVFLAWGDPNFDQVFDLIADFVANSSDFAAEWVAHLNPGGPDMYIQTDPNLPQAAVFNSCWAPDGSYGGISITINATLDFFAMTPAVAEEFGHANELRTNTAQTVLDFKKGSQAYEDRAKAWKDKVINQRSATKSAKRKDEKSRKREPKKPKSGGGSALPRRVGGDPYVQDGQIIRPN